MLQMRMSQKMLQSERAVEKKKKRYQPTGSLCHILLMDWNDDELFREQINLVGPAFDGVIRDALPI